MAFIAEHSCLAAKPELDLFSELPTSAAVEEGVFIEHLPITSLNDASPIKFRVSGDSSYYIDLNSTYLYFEVKIVNNDGTNLANTDIVGPINLLAHSLIQQADITMNDTLVSDSSNLYHYRAFFETLLSYCKEAKDSQLSMALYVKDKAGNMDDVADANTGLVKRRTYTAESHTVPLICRLHSDIFFQKRYLLNGVDLNLKLVRNPDSFLLMAAAGSQFKLKITQASLFVRKVKVNKGISLKHIEMLDKRAQPANYPIRRVEMKSYNIAGGSLAWNEENLYEGMLPKRIIIGMVDADAFDGVYNKNPFNFKNYLLKYCSLMVDGKMVPQKPYISDFPNHSTLRNYFSLYKSTGRMFNDSGIDIDRSEYERGYSLIAWDLTPDMDEDGCYHVIKKGNIRLELKFSQALATPISLIVYSEYDGSIRIDKNRTVLKGIASS